SGITVNIGANVTLIPAYLFYGSSSSNAPKIIALNFASGSVCSTIGTYTFYYCSSLPEVTIPSSITTIGSYAFYYCSGLKTVNNQSSLDIVAGATTHGYVAYYATSVLTGVTEGNVVYRITDTEKIALRAVSQTETTITLAEDCTGIAENAFKDLTTLTTITIPASVTSIGASAFSGCTGLTSITIPANVTSIGNYAFRDLTALTEINYNAKELTTALVWGSDIFYNAGTAGSGITVNIGASVTSIPDYLFFVSSSDYRPYVTTLNIGENVTSIGTYAFAYLRGLTSITIPEKVSSIGSDAFGGCTALTEINYNAKELTTALTSDSRIFTNAGRLSSGITVNIGSSVTSIPDYLFHAGHTSFTPNVATLIISENVTSIGTSAFSGLRALTSITISSSETSIASSAFYECYALAEVYDLSSLDIVAGNSDNGYVAYYAKVVHTTLDAPTRLLEENGVKYYVYDGEKIALCSTYRNATSITLAEDCTKINQYAFYNCEALTSITIPESV
ncbi:MAG: leucine-rich repeat protein, partial [Clostridia bacterium]|nr:leucine-rich repeat protein [Clostridia bacterium]